jgi:nucleoside phosphorylase
LGKVKREMRTYQRQCDLLQEVRKFIDVKRWRIDDCSKAEAERIYQEVCIENARMKNHSLCDQELQNLSKRDLEERKERSEFGKIHYGASCTGDKVVAAEEYELVSQLEDHDFELRCVEMEGAAVQAAIAALPSDPSNKKVHFAMFRGISDDATKNKSDKWQKFAADLAADFTIRFVQWHVTQLYVRA